MSGEQRGPALAEIENIPQEIAGVDYPRQEQEMSDTSGIKSGDIIAVQGKKVRVVGFTAKRGDPGRALFTKELTPQELEMDEMKQDFLRKRTDDFIESDPTATPEEVDAVRREWEKIYGQGVGADMQINKIYEMRYRKYADHWRAIMQTLESKMNEAADEAERQVIQSQIVEARENIEYFSPEAEARKRYIQEAIDRKYAQ